MDKREFKDQVYSEISGLARALSNPHRMEIVDLLANGKKTVEQIANEVHLSVANASQHLQNLKSQRLVKASRKKNFIFYSLMNDEFVTVWHALRNYVLMGNQEVIQLIKDFREERDALPTISMKEWIHKKSGKDFVLLDVRPTQEYEDGHLPHAVSVPLDKIHEMLRGTDKGKKIVVYCRGPLCVFADDAVQVIKQKGYDVSRLVEGFPDLKILETQR